MHWKTFVHCCALENIFVHRRIYLRTENIFLLYKHQWNTKWAFPRKLCIFTREDKLTYCIQTIFMHQIYLCIAYMSHRRNDPNFIKSELLLLPQVYLTRIPDKNLLASEPRFFGREADERATITWLGNLRSCHGNCNENVTLTLNFALS